MEKNTKKNVNIHITESLCCTAEVNTTLQINYTSKKKKNLKKDLKKSLRHGERERYMDQTIVTLSRSFHVCPWWGVSLYTIAGCHPPLILMNTITEPVLQGPTHSFHFPDLFPNSVASSLCSPFAPAILQQRKGSGEGVRLCVLISWIPSTY